MKFTSNSELQLDNEWRIADTKIIDISVFDSIYSWMYGVNYTLFTIYKAALYHIAKLYHFLISSDCIGNLAFGP